MAKKQLEVPGTERPTIKEIDDAGESYVQARDKRMKQGVKEKEAKDALIAVMKKHNLNVYRVEASDTPLVVTLVPGKDGVKVSEAEAEDEAGEEFDA